ncbi:MAG: rhomboid family intramembrane serine protease, partial [Cytophagales bacterium]|nr:rhomboid family intramembrane serine protease [Cytophagales bacterium]
MRALLLKLRLIFLPFLLTGAGFAAVYTFLHWLLVIRLALFPVQEEIPQFWLPAILPWIPILLWLRPRINLLTFKGDHDRMATLYQVVAWGAVGVPALIAQVYLVAATGKLTTLDTVNQLAGQPAQTKYYSLRKYYVDKGFAGINRTASVSGKYNERLDLYIYLTLPIWEGPLPALTPVPLASLAVRDSTAEGSSKEGLAARPLFVVDGVVITPAREQTYTVDPDRIESMHVLKGPSAIALYGDKGRNGAIVITTQKGPDAPGMPFTANRLASPQTIAWLGLRYHEQISNRLSDAEKEAAFRKFDAQTLEAFQARDVQQFAYLDRLGNRNDREEYLAAVKTSSQYDASRPVVVLLAVNEPFAARTGNQLAWIFGAFGIGSGLFFLLLLAPRIDGRAYRRYRRGNSPRQSELPALLVDLVPRPGFFVTPILMHLNLVLFLLMVIAGLGFLSFGNDDLLTWGANYRPLTVRGQWWRLLTSTFLHGGVLHLFMNLYGLLFVGLFLEPVLGRARLLLIYLLTGVLASLASLLWYPATVSVGASGAIFGLYGALLALLLAGAFPAGLKKPFLVSTV